MKKPLVVAAFLFLLPAGALAEIAVAESVEAMVAGSDLVVRARFVERRDFDAWPRGWSVSSYRVEEVLLGDAGETLEVLARDRGDEDDAKGAESLLFLRRHLLRFRESALAAAAARVPFRLGGQVRLDLPIEQFTMACEVITERDALIAAVHSAADHTRKAALRPPTHELEVSFGLDAFSRLYGGSAVYMIVPVDERLVPIARDLAAPKGDYEEQIGRDALRALTARARALERMAGQPAGEGDLAARLVRAEAVVAATAEPIRRAIAKLDPNDPGRALLRIRHSLLSPGPEDRAAVQAVFDHDLAALVTAARATRWPVVLADGEKDGARIVELSERLEGRVAVGVLRLTAGTDGKLRVLAVTDLRLYCFAEPDGGRVFHVDLSMRVLSADQPADDSDWSVPFELRGMAAAIPEGMEMDRLRLTEKNVRHWWGRPFGEDTPAWAAPFLVDEFRDTFPPKDPNRERETDPKRP